MCTIAVHYNYYPEQRLKLSIYFFLIFRSGENCPWTEKKDLAFFIGSRCDTAKHLTSSSNFSLSFVSFANNIIIIIISCN